MDFLVISDNLHGSTTDWFVQSLLFNLKYRQEKYILPSFYHNAIYHNDQIIPNKNISNVLYNSFFEYLCMYVYIPGTNSIFLFITVYIIHSWNKQHIFNYHFKKYIYIYIFFIFLYITLKSDYL